MVTRSERETFEYGVKLAKSLKGSEIIALLGDLGSGKTVFTKGVAHGLKIKEPITSPTFTIVHEYDKLNHFDVYRLENSDELFEIGFEEYLDKGKVTIIEWADLILDALPNGYITVKIEKINDESRRITIS